MNEPIDLGADNDPAMPSDTLPDAPQTPSYPDVALSHPSLINLPNIGKSVIEHEVVSRHHEKDSKGKIHHRVRIKIKSIRPMGRKKHSSGSHLAAENAMRDMMTDESQ